MANEKRLISAEIAKEMIVNHANEFSDVLNRREKALLIGGGTSCIDKCPTVDAVEVDDMREFAKDVAYQFGYYCQNGGRLHITHGGLSTLEWAFDILGWENPHPVPECECEIDGCHEHATCGASTADGYKWMCSKHYREGRTE